MSDITKCKGIDCPIKEHCFRFTDIDNEFRQAYFSEAPFEIIDNKFTCEMFWGEHQNGIFKMLKDILNSK